MVERQTPKEKQPLTPSEEVATKLLSIGAISVETDKTFTWSSGIESPVYSDMRLIMSNPEMLSDIAEMLAQKVERVTKMRVSGIAGTATAGIPHATLVAQRCHLPLVYIRSQAKDHGKGNQIEGVVEKGKEYVVIEDLISTGVSSINSANALREAGANCNNVVSIFNYNLPFSQKNSEEAGLTFSSLTDFPTVMQVAFENNLWTDQQVAIASAWYRDPQAWRGQNTIS